MRTIGVGIIGLGVVGSAVARALLEKQAHLASRVGARLELVGAAVRDRARSRPELPAKLLGGLSVHDGKGAAERLIADPRVDVVVELTGQLVEGTRLMAMALAAGKDVVTANKGAIASSGADLLAEAKRRSVELRFEAAVGGGIPLLRPIERDLAGNSVTQVRGIVNGTTNYILGRMAEANLPFADALLEAQQAGYAEPDPTADIDGTDAAYKLAILAQIAFSTRVAPQDVYREGIDRLSPRDLRYARELGYVIKLLAVARVRAIAGNSAQRALEVRVHPAFVPKEAALANVSGVLNAIEVSGDLIGSVVFQGPGAGGRATSSAIVGDVVAVAARRALGQTVAPPPELTADLPVLHMGEVRSRYYLRVQVTDRPGVFAQITGPLGDRGISLAQVVQREATRPGEKAEIVLLTYDAREADLQAAARTLATLPAVAEVSAVIRVETA